MADSFHTLFEELNDLLGVFSDYEGESSESDSDDEKSERRKQRLIEELLPTRTSRAKRCLTPLDQLLFCWLFLPTALAILLETIIEKYKGRPEPFSTLPEIHPESLGSPSQRATPLPTAQI
ncbi:hypothetical protein OUZ56_003670 [Daphnia magna]|uniref:Uncharacterized protein n=1 Tax=Daphnia magna TaxID=35525 RepID=A0ABR0A9E9_9CRUS|nr:hypothetical protein OUZ56_003670 [Daphnia magna]